MNRGVYTYPDGTRYEGEWKNGKRYGQGIQIKPDGRKHIGEWKDGRRHGPGVEIHPDGTKLFGEWEDGKYVEVRKPAVAYESQAQEFEEAKRVFKSGKVEIQKRQTDLKQQKAQPGPPSSREKQHFVSTELKQHQHKPTRKIPIVYLVLLVVVFLG